VPSRRTELTGVAEATRVAELTRPAELTRLDEPARAATRRRGGGRRRWARIAAAAVAVALLAGCTAANANSGAGEAGSPDPPEPRARTVTVVGDSLTVLGEQAVRSALSDAGWWAALDAFPGRTTGTQMDALRAAADRGNDATLIELGTNDALRVSRGELSVSQAEADIVAALDLFGDRCVVWVIPDRDPERRGADAGAAIDAIVKREAARRPALHVADLAVVLAAHPEYLVADRVHLTVDGYEALADLMARTLQACD
jgi:lysophospholipase L1-like esterase